MHELIGIAAARAYSTMSNVSATCTVSYHPRVRCVISCMLVCCAAYVASWHIASVRCDAQIRSLLKA